MLVVLSVILLLQFFFSFHLSLSLSLSLSNIKWLKYSQYCNNIFSLLSLFRAMCGNAGCQKWIVCDRQRTKKNSSGNNNSKYRQHNRDRDQFWNIFSVWNFTKITCIVHFLCQIECSGSSVELFAISDSDTFSEKLKTIFRAFPSSFWIKNVDLPTHTHAHMKPRIVSSFLFCIFQMHDEIFRITGWAMTRKQQKLFVSWTNEMAKNAQWTQKKMLK